VVLDGGEVPVAAGRELPLNLGVDFGHLVAALRQDDRFSSFPRIGVVHECVVGRCDVRDVIVGL
jgi:hypothetical protein